MRAQQAQAPAPQQQKELNLLTLCRIGQETVQEILTRFQEIFNHLKQVQPPNGKIVLVTSQDHKKPPIVFQNYVVGGLHEFLKSRVW